MKKIIALLLLCGCGFRPMFSGTDNDIYVEKIAGINGIELRNALNAKFGGAHDASAPYKLVVSLDAPSRTYRGLDTTGTATWQAIKLNAKYDLYMGDKKIASGSESAAESYTFVQYLVAANAAYNNAVQNAVSVLADKIGARAIAETQKNLENK
ncbi:MAG: LPS assembly lipoprotein LptE [Alphaproteobacteria bacterium]